MDLDASGSKRHGGAVKVGQDLAARVPRHRADLLHLKHTQMNEP